MSLTIQLLGRPTIHDRAQDAYQFRGRKSWALLAYLILTDRQPTRTELASLLFSEANDPLSALRWSLAEIRRALGDGASVTGDPVVLGLPPDASLDVEVLVCGGWRDAGSLPGIGAGLLPGVTIANAAAFESWLLSEQRYVMAASEAVIHEAALATMSRGDFNHSIRHAVQLVAVNPLDENHQALLIRLSGRWATSTRLIANSPLALISSRWSSEYHPDRL